MTDSPFKTAKRKTLTPQQRAKLFLERGGKCHKCTRKLTPGDDWIVEHMIALQNTTEADGNAWENLGITCDWCKPKKDAEDAKLAAKSRHVRTKHVTPGRVRAGRSFPGGRNSRWKKKVNGEVVPRD